ncbi:tryptophan synthase subunit alpha [bacterium]|nr:MAG: tryptophan synthase subunit alpha [bacterium]
MNRIEKKFRDLKKENRKAFIVFITAGYPDLEVTRKLILEFSKEGVDIIELGIPFSDPLADGPIIQEASQVALKNNVHLRDILSLVKKIRRQVDTPIVFMTYYNPLFCFGEERFVRAAKDCGVDGVIIPDLPPEEGRSFLDLASKSCIDTILFISPTTTQARMKFISYLSRGFIYYVSLTGVTGPRQRLPMDLKYNISIVKKLTNKPICVGFGVSSRKQVEQIYRIADGVIIGSAIVKKIRDNIGKSDLIEKTVNFVKSLQV